MLIAAAILITVPMAAYAKTDEGAEQEIDLSEILIPVVEPEPTPTPEPQPLTPTGNLTLVDDISGAQSEDKQFITVITKNGNYFYIIIDRADDKQNVHFLNLVDEADLLALLEDDKPAAPATITPAPVDPVTMPELEPEPAPEQRQNNTIGILLMVLVIAAVGGGAYYFFKVRKPKQPKSAAISELDDFEFDPDEDEFDGADYDGGYDGDIGDDMPDFTMPDGFASDTETDSGGEDSSFDDGDTDTETPESEEK
jgi:hypothetical protein